MKIYVFPWMLRPTYLVSLWFVKVYVFIKFLSSDNMDVAVSRTPSRLVLRLSKRLTHIAVLGSLYVTTWVMWLLSTQHPLPLGPLEKLKWPSLSRRTLAYRRSLLSPIVQFLLGLSRTRQKHLSVLKILSQVSIRTFLMLYTKVKYSL